MTPETSSDEAPSRRRRPTARLVSMAVGLAVVVSFVVENDQSVRVRLWFVTGHPRLIYVLLVTLIAGAVIGHLVGRASRRRRRADSRSSRLGRAVGRRLGSGDAGGR